MNYRVSAHCSSTHHGFSIRVQLNANQYIINGNARAFVLHHTTCDVRQREVYNYIELITLTYTVVGCAEWTNVAGSR